ncbi:AAA family ATPase [Paractinoplanes lichenicola]|uniref:AAA family ATPase n=1 Tax=Paractinoplanes lichenicola TaxID=2802976 RepID=A0ABS1VZE9_9ACTN|nr:AAA family ATPase [Actinoplanes lichenicola]MBL7259798.1 AAA family ATPase [Actinoplanes lichenicola]
MTPVLLVVTGPPGAGKSTLARRLALDLGRPALHRDEIHAGMDPPDMLRTYDVFFAAIRLYLTNDVSHVAEAAFQHPAWARGLEPLLRHGDVRILRCRASTAALDRRIAQRGRPPRDHTFDPVRLDVPTLDVETTDGYAPGLDVLRGFASPATSS